MNFKFTYSFENTNKHVQSSSFAMNIKELSLFVRYSHYYVVTMNTYGAKDYCNCLLTKTHLCLKDLCLNVSVGISQNSYIS